jgi:hypothetical protein
MMATMTSHRARTRHLLLLALLLGAASCDDDDYAPYRYIGHACRDDFDCAPGIDCHTGREFPDGTCTVSCRDHYDCPRGTACVNVSGGVCLVYCSTDQHCRTGYDCQARNDRRGPGESQVCVR